MAPLLCNENKYNKFTCILFLELDGVGPIDNRHAIDQLLRLAKKKKKYI